MFLWGSIAIGLFIIDALTSGALLLGFSISAFITAIISSTVSFSIQVLTFVSIGIILSIFIIPKMRKVPELKSYSDSLEGVIIKASQDMINGEIYQEKVKGIFWNIKPLENIKKDQKIKITKVDKENNYLLVKGE